MKERNFEQLNIISPLMSAIRTEGYSRPTPIQEEAIPCLLQGRDLLGCARTGTGKTAAFALPILQQLNRNVRTDIKSRAPGALILAPTRELAAQICQSFETYGQHTNLKTTVIFGGVKQSAQVKALRQGTDILIATPGRLLDLLGQKHVSLKNIEFFVLDEADRMLDMGFINDVNRIIKHLPLKRQTLLFSATMPPEIASLASNILINPVRIQVANKDITAENIEQKMHFVTRADKHQLLIHLLNDPEVVRALVFTRTKHGANRIVKQLAHAGIKGEAIHGNKSQTAREKALEGFKEGRTRLLIATDIASRGIDVDGITHVVNYDLPNIPETYVHRIGRTARAGSSGIALSFCDNDERKFLKNIEKLTGQRITEVSDHPFVLRNQPESIINTTSCRGKNVASRSFGNGRTRGRKSTGKRNGMIGRA